MQVGWLGLGAMGAPMAVRAARAGHGVRGYDVAPGRAAALAGDGVRPAGTVAAAAGGADLLVIMVATPGQAEEALFAPGGAAGSLAAGSIVMVMATVGPEAVVSAADRLAARGVAVVDAPVSGGTARAGPATCWSWCPARQSRWRGPSRCCPRWRAALPWSGPPPAMASG